MTHALAPLLRLPDVEPSLTAARAAVDALVRGTPAGQRPRLAGEVALRSAVDSAALEGHPFPIDDVRAGTVTDPVLQGALRVCAALGGLVATWRTAPRQALARVHVLAARDLVGADELGRPIAATARLDGLLELVVAPADGVPSLLRAAIVHGELLALRPFAGPSGVVARAAARLTLMADGLDAYGLVAPELGHRAREPEYVGTANAFSTGTSDGVRSWLKHVAAATGLAAADVSRWG